MTFLDIWVGYTIAGVFLFTAVFLWAARNGQFSNLDRGRHIPLDADRLIEKPGDSEVRPSRIDRYTWVSVLLLTVGMMVVVVVAAKW